jgi:hypothetical protein
VLKTGTGILKQRLPLIPASGWSGKAEVVQVPGPIASDYQQHLCLTHLAIQMLSCCLHAMMWGKTVRKYYCF